MPIDVILGWILTNEKRQRVFNKLGDTVVVKIKDNLEKASANYEKAKAEYIIGKADVSETHQVILHRYIFEKLQKIKFGKLSNCF